MRVRLLKPWKFRRVGTILNEMPDGMANLLIRRRVVEKVVELPKQQVVVEQPKAEKQEKPKRVRT